jgi:hypothetical protein
MYHIALVYAVFGGRREQRRRGFLAEGVELQTNFLCLTQPTADAMQPAEVVLGRKHKLDRRAGRHTVAF